MRYFKVEISNCLDDTLRVEVLMTESQDIVRYISEMADIYIQIDTEFSQEKIIRITEFKPIHIKL